MYQISRFLQLTKFNSVNQNQISRRYWMQSTEARKCQKIFDPEAVLCKNLRDQTSSKMNLSISVQFVQLRSECQKCCDHVRTASMNIKECCLQLMSRRLETESRVPASNSKNKLIILGQFGGNLQITFYTFYSAARKATRLQLKSLL